MKRTTVVLLILSLCSVSLRAQSTSDFRSAVIDKFTRYYTTNGTPEKIYIQTDREFYEAGDTIWLKAYLVDGLTNVPLSNTRFIYVELRGPGKFANRNDYLYERMKLRIHHNADSLEAQTVFDNRIELSEWMSPGVYTLRAFSHWMYNSPEQFIVSKNITIGYPDSNYATESVDYTDNGDGTVSATFNIKSPTGRPVAGCDVNVNLMLDGASASNVETTDADGRFTINFAKPKGASNYANIEYHSPQVPGYERRIDFPSFVQDYDVQFLPEGGNLIAGQLQLVAFKAVGKDGLACDVTGCIKNSSGESVADFHSTHLGMGSFAFMVTEGERYTAVVVSADSIRRTFMLPEVKSSGCAIALTQTTNKVMCRVLATPNINTDQLGIIIHNRGDICYVGDKASPVLLDKSSMNNGISSISVVDKSSMRTISERTFFVWNGEESVVDFSLDTLPSKPYGRAIIGMNIHTPDRQPITSGTYSLSVVDSSSYLRGERTIYSELLLSSDIKGHVEDPAYYFESNDSKHRTNMDLLMLTQGWHRFETDSILLGNIREPRFAHEANHTISGHIEGVLGFSKNAYLAIMEPMYRISKQGFYKIFQLGKDPSFSFVVDNAPYGMNYILQAWTNLGSKYGNSIILDDEVFPSKPIRSATYRYSPVRGNSEANFDYQSYLIRKYAGEKVVEIEAIPIKATTKRDNYTPTQTYTARNIEEMELKTLGDVLRCFPQIVENHDSNTVTYMVSADNGVNSTGAGLTQLKIFVNGDRFLELRHIDVNDIPINAVKYVDFVGYPQCSDIFMESYPVISVGMPEWYMYNTNNKGAISVVKNIGYREDTLFYAPKYLPDVDPSKITDKRKTIHWEPYITPDSLGHATVSFYTTASEKPYCMTLEGVSDGGILCRGRLVFNAIDAKKPE